MAIPKPEPASTSSLSLCLDLWNLLLIALGVTFVLVAGPFLD